MQEEDAMAEKRRELELQQILEKQFAYYQDRNFKILQATELTLQWDHNADTAADEPDDWRGSLEVQVQGHIELGWRPHGTVFSDTKFVWSPSGGSDVKHYCQAMVKEPGEEPGRVFIESMPTEVPPRPPGL